MVENHWRAQAASVTAVLTLALTLAPPAGAADNSANTATPIRHVIIVVGENRSFDHLFATYTPKRRGETVLNLLSQGIVNADGSPGPNFAKAQQYKIVRPPNSGRFFISAGAAEKELYPTLPAPDMGGVDSAWGPDTRIANVHALPPGPFQLTGPAMPFDSFSADTTHQFFQMYQQQDCAIDAEHVTPDNPTGCLHDLQSAVTTTWNTPPGEAPHDTGQSMAFYNMQQGDAPFFKHLADTYTMSDNYHQPVMGGSGPNMLPLAFADLVFFSDGHGNPVAPPAATIFDPDPRQGTLNLYKHRALWFDCSDTRQPGVAAIASYLAKLPYAVTNRCEPGQYYMAANVLPSYAPKGYHYLGHVVPPTLQRSLGDALSEKGISWKYYGGGFDADNTESPMAGSYCDICNPFEYQAGYQAMIPDHMRDMDDLFEDLKGGTLPAVSWVKPDGFTDGHPLTSKMSLYEAFVARLIRQAQGNKAQWAETAILVTVDEGGGFYDSGFVQPVDFFGTGPRIPMIAVSPWSKGGRVSHAYNEHSSFVKFVQRNWGLDALGKRSRDNLPNPVHAADNPYVPRNMPAIGDLFDLFDFDRMERNDRK